MPITKGIVALLMLSLASTVAAQQPLRLLDALKPKPAVQDVGDVDSFGRTLKWSGAKSSRFIQFRSDCGTPAIEGCYLTPPRDQLQEVDARELLSFKLPAGTAHSLICPALEELRYWNLVNVYPAPGVTVVNLSLNPIWEIESAALEGVVNTLTGEVYQGRLQLPPQRFDFNRVIANGEVSNDFGGSFCGRGGGISKQALLGMGVPQTAVDALFEQTLTLHLHAQGAVRNVLEAMFGYSVRLVTD